ncbi:MAG TPA: hypothetical protein VEQ34_02805, partial [Pyrinomonadaceae bacterium]|nr:hypothetical protein [Pyrinomonadaceae bacterium]
MFSTNNKENSTSLSKVIAVFSLMILCVTTTNTTNAQTNGSTYLDFTGDGKTDWTVIAPVQTQGQRYTLKILGNQTGSAPSQPFIRIFDFGLAGIDVIYAADYIGDRKTDLTAYRRGQPSIFYTAQFPIGTGGIQLERAVRWGAETDGSVQGDYDGDGKMDYTVVRRNANNALTWFILSSSTNVMRTVTFGNASLNSAVIGGADFTGDSKDELIIISDVNGKFVYYIGDAVTGAWLLTFQWGLAGN